MATIPLTPASGFTWVLPSLGTQVVKTPPVVDFTGAAINLSAYVSLALSLFSSSAQGTAEAAAVQTPAVTLTPEADGTIQCILDPTVITAIAPGGTVNCSIYGKATSGDSLQLLAQGQMKAALY